MLQKPLAAASDLLPATPTPPSYGGRPLAHHYYATSTGGQPVPYVRRVQCHERTLPLLFLPDFQDPDGKARVATYGRIVESGASALCRCTPPAKRVVDMSGSTTVATLAIWDGNREREMRPAGEAAVCRKRPGSRRRTACSLRLAAAAIRLRLRLLQYFSLYGLQLQQSKQLQQCRLAASRTRP
jgi:hypothetical protein|uniref:Uncharacterized protein n=1 Tax=Zea mays TaxID=4577 RepID=A0A804P4L6_MAIZE